MGGRKWWMIAVAVWFGIYGLLAVTSLQINHSGEILGFIGLAILLLIAFDK